MFGKNDVADKALLKSVERRLERTGMKTKLTATVRQGTVTLMGQLQYEKQRLSTVRAINGVSGVRQIIDRLVSPPKSKSGPTYHGGGYGSPRPAAEEATVTEPDSADQEEVILDTIDDTVLDAPEGGAS